MAFHARTFWVDPSKAKEENIKRNKASGFKISGPRSRSCFNCGDKYHFIAECPYENRETRGGRIIPKDKSKDSKVPNKRPFIKDKKNKMPSRIVLLTQEEYSSEDNNSDSAKEETSKEVAAIATTSTPSSSLFESPNENLHIKNEHCFMARSSMDTSFVLSTLEEYTSGDDDDDDESTNGLVALASISTTSSPPCKFPNENIHMKEENCFMAKSFEVYCPKRLEEKMGSSKEKKEVERRKNGEERRSGRAPGGRQYRRSMAGTTVGARTVVPPQLPPKVPLKGVCPSLGLGSWALGRYLGRYRGRRYRPGSAGGTAHARPEVTTLLLPRGCFAQRPATTTDTSAGTTAGA
ncbi:hypothetical protein QYE76_000410 [Lolium multiflorum]|uniref:CCHC-type domain-containing protein n=1 Tax=Lolium multiflorum TaxID=4521 RepID=A0AAD8RJZ3_LOLMU|nr:hypothetical protein QYE76_000410 [Lolium multiflorum]